METRARFYTTADDDERYEIYKEDVIRMTSEVLYIPLWSPQSFVYWQPWLKGYEGADMGAPTGHWWKTVQFIWIDQELKDSSK